jgi:hypothetical protein
MPYDAVQKQADGLVELDCVMWLDAVRHLSAEQTGLLFVVVLAPYAGDWGDAYSVAHHIFGLDRQGFDRLWTADVQRVFAEVAGKVIREVGDV